MAVKSGELPLKYLGRRMQRGARRNWSRLRSSLKNSEGTFQVPLPYALSTHETIRTENRVFYSGPYQPYA